MSFCNIKETFYSCKSEGQIFRSLQDGQIKSENSKTKKKWEINMPHTCIHSNTTIVLTKCIIKLEATHYYPLLERSSNMGESLTLLPEQVNDVILKERLLKVRCRYYKRKWKSFHVPNFKVNFDTFIITSTVKGKIFLYIKMIFVKNYHFEQIYWSKPFFIKSSQ